MTVPAAGNEAGAAAVVASLAEHLGFETLDAGPICSIRFLQGMAVLYPVPYLQGRREDALEFYLRKGASPDVWAFDRRSSEDDSWLARRIAASTSALK